MKINKTLGMLAALAALGAPAALHAQDSEAMARAKRYVAAGADIIETNTFSSTRIAQADYGMEEMVYDLNRDGARLAKRRPERIGDALITDLLYLWDTAPAP